MKTQKPDLKWKKALVIIYKNLKFKLSFYKCLIENKNKWRGFVGKLLEFLRKSFFFFNNISESEISVRERALIIFCIYFLCYTIVLLPIKHTQL